MRPLRPALVLLTTACLVAAATTAATTSASASASDVVVTDVDGLATALQDATARVRLGSDITVNGTLHFIGQKRLDLDSHTLVTQGIELDSGTVATIADSGTTGTLVAAGETTSGIGISGATLIVDGGSIDAKGKGTGASGIGSTDIHENVDADGGTLIVNGGDVTATGDDGGSGIGGGNSNSAGGTVTINGGRVSATGGAGAAGIGGIENGPGSAVTIAKGAAVEARAGAGGASAVGPGASTGGSPAPSFGSIRLSGTLSARTPMLIPEGATLTIGSTGLLESSSFGGDGTIANGGVITSVAASDSHLTVTGHNYLLSFRSNFTGGAPAIGKRVYARSLTLAQQALPTPVRSGWTFGGWKSATSATGSSFTATTTITANHAYYAQWKDTPKLSLALPSSLKAKKTASVVVTLKANKATTRPTGTVRVYYGSKYVTATYKSSTKSAVTVTIPALKKGSYSLYARYFTTDFFVGVKTAPKTLKAK